jgi:hypothetical protein
MTANTLPAAREPKAHLVAGGPVAALVPQSLEEAFRVAGAIAASGLAPAGLKTQEQIMVAIMAGAELGLAPFQALQSFAVVNNRPTLWGDGLMAVARAQGVKVFETLSGDGDDMIATCTVTRPDTGEEITRTFSVVDAKKAALWGKAGPWQSYPKRMLAMRARAWALRDGCADFLRGFQVREEVEDFQPVRDVTPRETGIRARLEARAANADAGPGFSADAVENGLAETPAHDPETGEIHDAQVEPIDPPADDGLPIREDAADDFPGDTPSQPAKPSLAERIAAFKTRCEAATGTVKLQSYWAASSELRSDLDASDPDALVELTGWWQARFDAVEAEEKAGL